MEYMEGGSLTDILTAAFMKENHVAVVARGNNLDSNL